MTRLMARVMAGALLLVSCVALVARGGLGAARAQLEEYIERHRAGVAPRWRPLYHVAPPVGWMNDPNGFVFHGGEFHLFYQFYPYDSAWGPMHWGHVASADLASWRRLPTALLPEAEQCFSGSAVSQGERLALLYTGRVAAARKPPFREGQYLAHSDDGVLFHKHRVNPVLRAAPDDAPDFRDPKVWRRGERYYAVIGSGTRDGRGRALLYASADLTSWEFLAVLAESAGDLGYMWECPDFFELGGRFVLLLSPQGVRARGDRFRNTFQTGYIIGSFDYDTNRFVPEVPFQELDFGHDFYAATTTEAAGKRYLIAWFAMWDTPHPEAVDGWAGMLTLPRELRLAGDRVVMAPAAAVARLRGALAAEGELRPNCSLALGAAAELLVDLALEEAAELELAGRLGGGGAHLRWEPRAATVALERGAGDERRVRWAPAGSERWRVFLDASSVELFCGEDGEGGVALSSRVYPLGGWRVTNRSARAIRVTAYDMGRGAPE